MAVFDTPLGFSVVNSPLRVSPFTNGDNLSDANNPSSQQSIQTEDFVFILTESGDFLSTE